MDSIQETIKSKNKVQIKSLAKGINLNPVIFQNPKFF